MNKREVLELMRDVFMCDASWNVGLIAEINRRIAALPAAAQASVPLGGLSQEVIDHHRKLRAEREAAWGVGVPDPMRGIDAQAKGEEGPTWNAVWDAVKDAETAWARRQFDGDDTSLEAAQNAAVRSLMLRARPAPSRALVEAADAMRHAPSCPHACWDEPDRSHVANCPYHATELAYDLARSSLPAAKKDA